MTIIIEDTGSQEKSVIHNFLFCSELNLIITASNNLIKIWKLTKNLKWDKNRPQVLDLHTSPINCLNYLSLGKDGILLASGGAFDEPSVKLWHLDQRGVWNGCDPESLKINTTTIKSLDMQLLANGGVLLAVGGGEYGDNLSVYKLTPEFYWDKNKPLIFKDFTYWAYPVSLHSFSNGKITLIVSGSWMETFLKIWTFDENGNWDGSTPLTLNFPPDPDYESNYLRSFSLYGLPNYNAIIVASLGSSEDEYVTRDAGYTIFWNFDSSGIIVEEKPIILSSNDSPIENIAVYIQNDSEFLLASRFSHNKISIKQFVKSDNKWIEQNNQLITNDSWVKIGCFIKYESDIFLIGISENNVISWNVKFGNQL